MCSGALYWAGIRSVVYSCDESRLGEIVKRKQKGGEVKELGDKDGGLDVPCRDILRDRCCVEGSFSLFPFSFFLSLSLSLSSP